MGREENRGAMLQTMPKGGVCAEVGVWDGHFSQRILDITQPKKLYLIDPWLFQPEFRGTGFGNQANADSMEGRYESVCEMYKSDDRVEIQRAMSHEALEKLDDASLDWVYLDGNHTYEVVTDDLALCLKKVKPNGVIAGDDFWWRAKKGAPVRTAVMECVDELKDEVEFSNMGQQYVLRLARAS